MPKKIAIVRVRGFVKVKKEIKDTFDMLRLYNKNYCVVVEDSSANMGMIKRVKDYATYGEITPETFKELIAKRGEEYKGNIEQKNKFMEMEGKKYNKFFRLQPPRKGYGRKGLKKPFSKAGALGYRGTKINDLIKRMI